MKYIITVLDDADNYGGTIIVQHPWHTEEVVNIIKDQLDQLWLEMRKDDEELDRLKALATSLEDWAYMDLDYSTTRSSYNDVTAAVEFIRKQIGVKRDD